jgi:hypothetical protein
MVQCCDRMNDLFELLTVLDVYNRVWLEAAMALHSQLPVIQRKSLSVELSGYKSGVNGIK